MQIASEAKACDANAEKRSAKPSDWPIEGASGAISHCKACEKTETKLRNMGPKSLTFRARIAQSYFFETVSLAIRGGEVRPLKSL